ncbi:MAG: hypothetical protein ACOH19_17545 [Rhodoglobus sp.]
MKFLKVVALTVAIAHAVSLISLVIAWGYANLGALLGQQWASLDGPEPVWPAFLGYGGMWLGAITFVILVVIGLVALVATRVRDRRAASR